MTCDVCGFDVAPGTGQTTADTVLCAGCMAKVVDSYEETPGCLNPPDLGGSD